MRVMIRNARYDDVAGPVEEILEAFPKAWKGASVLVKPNVLGPWTADAGVTTHPSVIGALVRSLRARGARVMVGDNPGLRGYAENERSFRACGLLAAADGAYVNIGRNPARVKINSTFVDEIAVSGEILDCDLLVSVPKFKTHALTMITGAVKNTYGYIVGTEKALLHSLAVTLRRFSEIVVDVYALRPPDLSIMDGVVCMDGNGPSGGRLLDAGKIIASDNAVSLDAVMAHMMGVRPESVPMLAVAHRRGLGEIDLAKIAVDGPLEAIPGFRMPRTFIGGLVGPFIHRFVFPFLRTTPRFNPDRCTRCKVCYEICPVKAISWDDGPVLDRRKCISCFCCMESCRFRAVELTGLIYKVRDRIAAKDAPGGPASPPAGNGT
ncbi:MAG: DUF362 domain-containing protein [bacterium]|nr:DUF362 domain-containing protein [bacterium]